MTEAEEGKLDFTDLENQMPMSEEDEIVFADLTGMGKRVFMESGTIRGDGKTLVLPSGAERPELRKHMLMKQAWISIHGGKSNLHYRRTRLADDEWRSGRALSRNGLMGGVPRLESRELQAIFSELEYAGASQADVLEVYCREFGRFDIDEFNKYAHRYGFRAVGYSARRNPAGHMDMEIRKLAMARKEAQKQKELTAEGSPKEWDGCTFLHPPKEDDTPFVPGGYIDKLRKRGVYITSPEQGYLSTRELARGGRGSSGEPPGKMFVEDTPIKEAISGRLIGRGWGPSDAGTVPRHIDRWCSDKRILSARIKKPGVSMLLDASGSMCIPSSEIHRLLEEAPASIVALYCGRKMSGSLAVIVQRGKKVPDELIDKYHKLGSHMGNGNIIDVPALEWLAMQPSPRIWVSDGMVSGLHDSRSNRVTVMTGELVRKYNIWRADDIEAAIEFSRGLH